MNWEEIFAEYEERHGTHSVGDITGCRTADTLTQSYQAAQYYVLSRVLVDQIRAQDQLEDGYPEKNWEPEIYQEERSGNLILVFADSSAIIYTEGLDDVYESLRNIVEFLPEEIDEESLEAWALSDAGIGYVIERREENPDDGWDLLAGYFPKLADARRAIPDVGVFHIVTGDGRETVETWYDHCRLPDSAIC